MTQTDRDILPRPRPPRSTAALTAGPDDPVHVDTSHPAPFVERHIGPSPDDVAAMLEVVGQPSLDALVDVAVPGAIRSQRALRLDAAPSRERRGPRAARAGQPQHA